jgi:hypothetical protein
MSDCVTCGALPDVLSANTGRSEYLPDDVLKLKRLWNTSFSNDLDVMLCPTCGAWFEWRDETAWTGSGNGDSETLKRLPPEAWVVLERLLHGDVGDGFAVLEAARTHLSDDLSSRALGRMNDSTFEAMLPALVKRFVTTPYDLENHALYGLLRRVETREPLRSQYLALAKASTHPLPARAKYLVELCEAEARKQR